MSENTVSPELLNALYAQIEEICREFKVIRGEAEEILQESRMPDAALHLNDVLVATEEATITIIEAVTIIGTLIDVSCLPFEAKEEISEQVGKIYEACNFQDISGQRIKKVLQHLNSLEERLLRLSNTAHGNNASNEKAPDSLLNGPQLMINTPSQTDVDAMFSNAS